MPETNSGLVINTGLLVASGGEGFFRDLAPQVDNSPNSDEVTQLYIQNKKLQFAAVTPDFYADFESCKQGKIIELFSQSADMVRGEY